MRLAQPFAIHAVEANTIDSTSTHLPYSRHQRLSPELHALRPMVDSTVSRSKIQPTQRATFKAYELQSRYQEDRNDYERAQWHHPKTLGSRPNQACTSSGSIVKIPGLDASFRILRGGVTPSMQNSSTAFRMHGGGLGLPTITDNRFCFSHHRACVSSGPSPVQPPTGFSQRGLTVEVRFRPLPYSRSANLAGAAPSANSRRRPRGSGLSTCHRSLTRPNSLRP